MDLSDQTAIKQETKQTLPSLSTIVRQNMSPENEEPSKDNFDSLYDQFIRQYHKGHVCRIADHINKFNDPPTYQKKTFSTFDLFLIVRDCGGIQKVYYTKKLQKLPRQWTLTTPANHAPKNWTQVATQLGYDTKATNISFRIKEWLRYHHIDAFFDYLMGIPNEFYTTEVGVGQPNIFPPSQLMRYSLDGHMDAMDISEAFEPNRKRSSDSLHDIRKRTSITSLSSPMRSLHVDVDDYEQLERPQLIQLIQNLQNQVQELQQNCRRYEDHMGAKDQRIALLQTEVEEKTVQIQKASQFKDLLYRYIDYLPDTRM